ncbi:MAG: polyprenol phosphomannose-dependent alpha 1,6 mannosyltransferase MptB [Nesterenkonia sp.]|uniref:polyprenol phosphomannose-dependent alpha 1,6 mannosyltransferase MptB n=1 Tax=Nesterenkonia marinintestina TaxID=2979865 RepID=UPI0021C05C35|nr:polyprenol phosphomannose-dependent alpha 1,6 mannosyltransferase MptB [Nesterenkonia sp. GX14115]MDO5493602.1 polyprenol phosphomannose-dependent alpha 1,6 mannosyltransferase MptB [Nesterenkonia sp.]
MTDVAGSGDLRTPDPGDGGSRSGRDTAPADEGRRRRESLGPLLEGVLGSLLVLFGSLGVGWLVNTSRLARHELVIPLRTEPAGVVVCTVALTLGCWIMFRAWLRLGRTLGEFGGSSLRTVNIAVVLWSLPQLVVVPIFSRDVFAYLGQGRLVLAGEDPYTTGVSHLANWFQLGTDITWAEDETPYGPLFLWVEAAVMRLTGEDVDLAILLFRLVCVAGVVLMMVYIPKLARLHGVDPARAQWIAAANPLLIISFISSAHNDALMIGFALAGVYWAARGRGVVATLLIVLSIGVKPITMVLLPFIGLLWAGPGASWRRRFGRWAMTAGLAGGVLAVIGLVQGYGFGWVTVLAGTGTGSVFWSPLGIMDGFMITVLDAVGIPHFWTLDTLKNIARVLSVLIVLALMFRGPDRFVVQRMMWAFTALVVLSPIIQPWYLLWLLPLFAVTGIRRGDWQLTWVAFTVAFFLAFGAADQLSIWQFLEMDQQMIVLSQVVSWACIVWLAVLDPGTRWVVLENLGLRRVHARWRAARRAADPPRRRRRRSEPPTAEDSDA